MGFKTQPSRIARVTNTLENLPRRLLGRPLNPPNDPEICGFTWEGYIRNAFTKTDSFVTDIKLLGGECLKLGTCLDGKSVDSVYITCANCTTGTLGTSSSAAFSTYDSMQLCLSMFGGGLSQSTVDELVFLELIHLCGGTDLDAFALDYYFFHSGTDAGGSRYFFPLPSAVLSRMCAGGTSALGVYKVGKFVVWVPSTGQLYAKQLSPTANLGWVLSGSSLTGISHPYWQYMCP